MNHVEELIKSPSQSGNVEIYYLQVRNSIEFIAGAFES
jgi:hypothetical protein